jgi:hypothetical protein
MNTYSDRQLDYASTGINAYRMVLDDKEYDPNQLATENDLYLIHKLCKSDGYFVQWDFLDNWGGLWTLGRWHNSNSCPNKLHLVNDINCIYVSDFAINKLKDGYFQTGNSETNSSEKVQRLFIDYCNMEWDMKRLKSQINKLKDNTKQSTDSNQNIVVNPPS